MNMKKINVLLVALVLGIAATGFSQNDNVGIGTTTPDPSALLDLEANDKGFLIPRVALQSEVDVTTIASPATSLLVFNTNAGMTNGGIGFWYFDGTKWVSLTSSGSGGGGTPSTDHNTLNEAYNEGGPGAGRVITANSGAVEVNHSSLTSGNKAFVATTNQNASFAVDATNSGTGVALRGQNTQASNEFAAIQGETNSSVANNSAILGSNSGAGYGVSGQIPSTATGTAAVYGNNLRTNGGHGVLGEGFNGVVGATNRMDGFGVYGMNTGAIDPNGTQPTAGVYGIGGVGIYGQTTDPTNGWAGYFTSDVGLEGNGYVTGQWFTVSDIRLKNNVTRIPNALEKIMSLTGNTYTLRIPHRNENGELTTRESVEYGVIAQEVEATFPEMVKDKAVLNRLGDNTVYKVVSYEQLIPVAIEAIKELNERIVELEERIRQLESN